MTDNPWSRQFSDENVCTGTWWKFSEYVVDANCIRPTDAASLVTYDPWEEFERETKSKSGSLSRPYLSLLEISKAFDLVKTGVFAHLDPKTWPIITDWFRSHGSLGLFFIEARQVNLYPRWGRNEPLKLEECLPAFYTQIRTPTGWKRQTSSTWNVNTMSLPSDKRVENSLVPKEHWTDGWEPGVIVTNEQGVISRAKLADFMGRFFQTIQHNERETYIYPTPFTEAFWRLYSESIVEFLNMAHSFEQMVRTLIRGDSETSPFEAYKLEFARQRLLYFSSQVNPSLYPKKDGSFGREWVCTSLMASFSMMVQLDLQRGLLNECANCETIFVSSAGRARFCSERCRKTMLQREWRDRKASGYSQRSTGAYKVKMKGSYKRLED